MTIPPPWKYIIEANKMKWKKITFQLLHITSDIHRYKGNNIGLFFYHRLKLKNSILQWEVNIIISQQVLSLFLQVTLAKLNESIFYFNKSYIISVHIDKCHIQKTINTNNSFVNFNKKRQIFAYVDGYSN